MTQSGHVEGCGVQEDGSVPGRVVDDKEPRQIAIGCITGFEVETVKTANAARASVFLRDEEVRWREKESGNALGRDVSRVLRGPNGSAVVGGKSRRGREELV